MKKTENYRVIQTAELQVWDGKKQAFETVVERASFFKEDDKQLFIGRSAKRCTLYAKTDKGLVAGPSMFTRAEYLGGAFIFSKGRKWFLQFLNSEDCAILGRDATYRCIGGLYVIEAYSVERRDNIVFLYSPQTQEVSVWYDIYYEVDGYPPHKHFSGIILRKGNDYTHVSVTQKKKLLGRYDKDGDYFWRRSDAGTFIISYIVDDGRRWESERYCDLSMYQVPYCAFGESAYKHHSRIATKFDGAFDIVKQVESSDPKWFVPRGLKDDMRGVCLLLETGDEDKKIPMRIAIGCPERYGVARYRKVFEGEVYLQWFNLIVVRRGEWFVLYHIGRQGTLTEIERSAVLDYNPGKFWCKVPYDSYTEVDYWGEKGIKLARETAWHWTLSQFTRPRSDCSSKRSWWRRLFNL